MTQTITITKTSTNISRAAARLFGQHKNHITLIARGRAGLESAVRDVKRAGGTTLTIPTNITDFAQVNRAAKKIKAAFKPIDVWVNMAFASVFTPFAKTTAEEFRRVTEVTYLGFVHNTMATLTQIQPRDRNTIVQIGSTLGAHSIPLQAAYCGGKHTINKFTKSLRCELLHDKTNVHITVVQMPAVNTPQFSWIRSKLPKHPQPIPPIYQPKMAARAVLYAAGHPRRKQYFINTNTIATILANQITPTLLDRYLARTGYDSQQTSERKPSRPDNL